MVLSKILGTSNSEDESLEDVEAKIQGKESELRNIRGQQQLEDLKKQRKKELKQKQKELKKKEFEQTRAGKLLGNLGDSLDSLSNNIDGSNPRERQTKDALNTISNQIEVVDGDGKQDNESAVDFFGTRKSPEMDEVVGKVEVEGTLNIEDYKADIQTGKSKEKDPFDVDTNIDMSF